MHISYQHANPFTGRESVVLRIDGLLPDQTVCVLIDTGEGVAIDNLLDEDEEEYLTAICLTHAHLDHYKTLDENLRDGAPIYAAPDTAAILEDAIAAGNDFDDQESTETVLDRLSPIDGWTTIVNGLRVRPVPAGHTPGAAGVLLSVDDDDEQRTILATGDFTMRRAAGYPGFEPDLPIDIDVLLLNAASNADVETKLTETVARLIDRALAGSTVLATASGLTGLHLAYLLGHANVQLDISVPIRLVGHAATLADRLNYDIPSVSTHQEFTDPTTILDSGCITIAGPEVPSREGPKSADRLFATIDDDPGATLVQVLSGTNSPIRTAGCTVHDEFLSNHPSREKIDALVDQLTPMHVVILHQKGPAADRYKDKFASYVWVTDDQTRHTLLDERGWTPPPWVSTMTRQRVEQSSTNTSRYMGDGLEEADGGLLFPSMDRRPDVDLEAEGLDIEAVIQRAPTLSATHSPSQTTGSQTTTHSHSQPQEPTTSAIHEASDVESRRDGKSVTEDASLEQILDRLDRLESTIQERRYPARVLDTQNGVTLLRVEEELPNTDTGETVGVVLGIDDE
ncbi:MBL fold metallo-hydrolase [Halocatena marina]|uniref:MBL fold metallo-hydrolase n=1 Tax=Halocatena marina TaxID=2934937 RepID=UPI0022257D07|nr:MBL fold metallo-hydrolase [Halocatena marina]